MKQAFCLFIAVVFLFGASVVQGMSYNIQLPFDITCMAYQVEYSIGAFKSF